MIYCWFNNADFLSRQARKIITLHNLMNFQALIWIRMHHSAIKLPRSCRCSVTDWEINISHFETRHFVFGTFTSGFFIVVGNFLKSGFIGYYKLVKYEA